MSDNPAAAPPASHGSPEPPRGFGRLLLGRSRKAAAAVLLAFLGALGAALFAWTKTAGESAVHAVLPPAAGKDLDVRVAAPGTFFTGSVIGNYYVLPKRRVKDPSQMGAAAWSTQHQSSDDVLDYAWVRTHGGVAGSPQIIRLELRTTSDEPVTITGIAPEVVTRTRPLRGWYLAAPACGAEPIRIAEIDLDSPRPSVHYYSDQGTPGGRHLALTVTRTDSEQLELHASTKKQRIGWRATIFYSAPRGDGSITVDDNGRPFRVTTETASDGYSPALSGNRRAVKREHDWDGKGISAC
jgi:hypothetical protein